MVNKGHALSRDALIRTLTAYSGITSSDGAADGTTLVDTNLIDNASISPSGIPEKTVLILNGNARGEDKGAVSFNNGTGTITLQGTGFSAQIKAGTIYRILNISSIEIDVANIDTKIGTNTDPAGTTTLFAWLALLAASGSAIFDIVNALLMLTETGGTVTTTAPGTEDNIYVNDAPAGEYYPLKVVIDLSDLEAGEVAIIRTYYRIKSGGTARLKDEVTFNGVQAQPMKNVELEPNRFGCSVTIEATTGVVVDWEAHYEV